MSAAADAPMVLSLDLGTHTGVVRGRPGDRPEATTWRMPEAGREDMGAFADAFDRRMAAAIAEGPLGLIVYEAPFLGPKIANNMHTARRLLWMPGTVEMHAHRAGIEVVEAPMMTVRKGFVGSGKAEKWQTLDAAERRGFAVTNHHEADAAACWWFAVICRWPGLAAAYDPLMAHQRPRLPETLS